MGKKKSHTHHLEPDVQQPFISNKQFAVVVLASNAAEYVLPESRGRITAHAVFPALPFKYWIAANSL